MTEQQSLSPSRFAYAATILLTSICLSACQSMPGMTRVDDQRTIMQLEDLLTLMQQLIEADPATHKSLDAQLQQQYDADPSETNKMRLAVALTTPGHTHAEILKAQQMIDELQSQSESLPRVIKIYLKTRIDATKQTYALEGKVKALSTGNKSLNQQLEEVKAQIKALTAIEQNLEKTNPRAAGAP